MLTSHHYLLGSLVAVSCATGIISHSVAASQNWLPVSSESALVEYAGTDAVDVSYRGSGRMNDTPPENKNKQNRGPVAHRGSGRVRPQSL